MSNLEVEYEVTKIKTVKKVDRGEGDGDTTVTLRGPLGAASEKEVDLEVGGKLLVELDLTKAVTASLAEESPPPEQPE